MMGLMLRYVQNTYMLLWALIIIERFKGRSNEKLAKVQPLVKHHKYALINVG